MVHERDGTSNSSGVAGNSCWLTETPLLQAAAVENDPPGRAFASSDQQRAANIFCDKDVLMPAFTRDQIAETVLRAIDNLNPQLPTDRQLERSLTARLFGREAPLDSLGLVNFIVAVEEQLSDDLDLTITLANEKAMSRKTSPFRSVDVLIDFVMEMLADDMAAAA